MRKLKTSLKSDFQTSTGINEALFGLLVDLGLNGRNSIDLDIYCSDQFEDIVYDLFNANNILVDKNTNDYIRQTNPDNYCEDRLSGCDQSLLVREALAFIGTEKDDIEFILRHPDITDYIQYTFICIAYIYSMCKLEGEPFTLPDINGCYETSPLMQEQPSNVQEEIDITAIVQERKLEYKPTIIFKWPN